MGKLCDDIMDNVDNNNYAEAVTLIIADPLIN